MSNASYLKILFSAKLYNDKKKLNIIHSDL